MCVCGAGLVSLSPENLLDHQCELVRVLAEARPGYTPQWLSMALMSEPLKQATASAGEEGAALFLQLMAHRPPLRHDAIVRQFGAMCRRTSGIDGLRAFVPA